jgi:hypothetical protein
MPAMRRMTALLLLLLATAPAFAAPKPPPAPDAIPHAVAMFMAALAGDGKTKVTYTAAARGTHFFFEQSGGVTVYTFEGDGYKKSEFLKGSTLAKALKKYDSGK